MDELEVLLDGLTARRGEIDRERRYSSQIKKYMLVLNIRPDPDRSCCLGVVLIVLWDSGEASTVVSFLKVPKIPLSVLRLLQVDT